MKADEARDRSRVLAALGAAGLLMLQDGTLEDAIELLAGGPVRGSWWSHPKASHLYAVLEGVSNHPDVLVIKLVAAKVTFVHRRLWPALLGVAVAREPWQLDGLSAEAQRLLVALDAGRSRPTDEGRAASRDLEARLLAHGESVHTTSGKHATRLEPWSAWAARTRAGHALPPAEGRRALETALAAIGGKAALLPWNGRRRGPRASPRPAGRNAG